MKIPLCSQGRNDGRFTCVIIIHLKPLRMKKHILSLALLGLPAIGAVAQPLSVATYYDATTKKLAVVDQNTGDTIIRPVGQPLWTPPQPNSSLSPVVIEPTISVTTYSDGFDVIYDYENTTESIGAIGSFYISRFRFDSVVYSRNFRTDGYEETLNHHGNGYGVSAGWSYPGVLYSPVAVFGNDQYTVGISVIYPVLDYRHGIHFRTQSPGGGASPTKGWELAAHANQQVPQFGHEKSGNRQLYYDYGDLKPGETRQYKITVRFTYRTDGCRPWHTTLEPYRKYFRSKYGGVTYTRQPDPVAGINDALMEYRSPTNPYCWKPSEPRPDIVGFGPLTRKLISRENYGFKRMMLWKPTGGYYKHPENSMPFKFTSHWLEGDTTLYPTSYGHNMADALDSLPLVAQDGRQLGLWWGRSGQVMYDWDVAHWETLDPDNPVHVATAFHELDLAVQAGATLIGLDAFNEYLTPWDGYRWLAMLRAHAPGVKFAVEPGSGDFLHTRAASVYNSRRVRGPHYLANFLLPGNEIYGRIPGNASNCMDTIHHLASSGFVPIPMNGCAITQTLTPPYVAAESWYETNPFPELKPMIGLKAGDTLELNASYANPASFSWSTGDTTSSIKVTSPGRYIVNTVNVHGCAFSDTTLVYALLSGAGGKPQSVGTEAVAVEEMIIFPNPSNGETLLMQLPGVPAGTYSLVIYSNQGQKVFQREIFVSGTEGVITLHPQLASGVYHARLSDGKRKYTQTVLIQK
jgi:hypothetical protein